MIGALSLAWRGRPWGVCSAPPPFLRCASALARLLDLPRPIRSAWPPPSTLMPSSAFRGAAEPDQYRQVHLLQRAHQHHRQRPGTGASGRWVDFYRQPLEPRHRSIRLQPKKGTGQIAASFSKGVMRFVGGKISKNEGGVSVDTPAGALAIRGGIAYADFKSPKNFSVLFFSTSQIKLQGQTVYEPGERLLL